MRLVGFVAAAAAVLLCVTYLWYGSGGHFILRTLDYATQNLAKYWKTSLYLVRGIVIIGSIPFFWAVAKYTHGFFWTGGLRPSLRLYRNPYGLLIVAYVGISFITMYFASRDKFFYMKCADTPKGIYTSDTSGVDPVWGIPLHDCTKEEIIELTGTQPKLVCVDKPAQTDFFDSVTGKPRIWHCELEDGSYRFFDSIGKCPFTGEPTKPIDRPMVQDIFQHKIRLAPCTATSPSEPAITNAADHPHIKPPQKAPPITAVALPKSLPKPKPHIVEAGESVQIGDFSFIMKECRHVSGSERCEGSIRNESDSKLQLTILGGYAVDDKGNTYTLSNGPYLLFNPGILFFGSANVQQELMPGIPVKFGFANNFRPEATATNLIIKFTTTGTPAESEVTFKDIPILE